VVEAALHKNVLIEYLPLWQMIDIFGKNLPGLLSSEHQYNIKFHAAVSSIYFIHNLTYFSEPSGIHLLE
jgi:hypothetical protein